jgi:ubiquitin C-terminal hydrolase
MFMGYSQHDSQEFLLILLDKLHEDFNNIKVKPTLEKLMLRGSDDELSNKFW